jgi:hypothetical protein
MNNSPWGLRVISTNKPAVNDEDTSLILSHRLPGCKSLENVTKHHSIWMGADSDWTALMINLGTVNLNLTTVFFYARLTDVFIKNCNGLHNGVT